jgi:XTP/dITP diphosphohydrolase
MTTIYLGTTNPGKVRELASLLSPMGLAIELVALEVPETGDSFEENARQKALAYARHTGGVTICEDSGIVVPALGGLPGPWSARFADLELDAERRPLRVVPSERPREEFGLPAAASATRGPEFDRLNNERLLELLRGVPQPQRAAVFKVRLVVARGDAILFETSGEAHGWVAEEARGERGFGYDPVFVGQDTFGKTYAELDPVRKNLRSHRGRLLGELQHWLGKALRERAL